MTIFIMLGLIMGVTGLAAILITQIQELSKPKEVLGSVKESSLCKSHSWGNATFVRHEDKEAFFSGALKVATSQYCRNCGFVPGKDEKMVKPFFLGVLAAQELQLAQKQQDLKDIQELKEDFFKEGVKDLATQCNTVDVRTGYDLYDEFVSQLPYLLATKQAARKLVEKIDKEST